MYVHVQQDSIHSLLEATTKKKLTAKLHKLVRTCEILFFFLHKHIRTHTGH